MESSHQGGEGASQSLGSRILPVSLGFRPGQLKLTNLYMTNWFKWWPDAHGWREHCSCWFLPVYPVSYFRGSTHHGQGQVCPLLGTAVLILLQSCPFKFWSPISCSLYLPLENTGRCFSIGVGNHVILHRLELFPYV